MGNIQCEQKLNSVQFVKLFNDISHNYHACRSILGLVNIIDNETRELVAQLCADLWIFFKQAAFDYDELDLMAKLAATSPELRGGINND